MRSEREIRQLFDVLRPRLAAGTFKSDLEAASTAALYNSLAWVLGEDEWVLSEQDFDQQAPR